jgi:hypothetical protein
MGAAVSLKFKPTIGEKVTYRVNSSKSIGGFTTSSIQNEIRTYKTMGLKQDAYTLAAFVGSGSSMKKMATYTLDTSLKFRYLQAPKSLRIDGYLGQILGSCFGYSFPTDNAYVGKTHTQSVGLPVIVDQMFAMSGVNTGIARPRATGDATRSILVKSADATTVTLEIKVSGESKIEFKKRGEYESMMASLSGTVTSVIDRDTGFPLQNNMELKFEFFGASQQSLVLRESMIRL